MNDQLHNIEAEQGLLGVLLMQNAILHRVNFLNAGDFNQPVHQRLFDAICRCVIAGQKADPVTLKPEFDRDPDLLDIGGGAYLSKLYASAVAVHDVRAYAREVKRFSLLRSLDETLAEAAGLLENPAANPEEIAAQVSSAMISLTEGSSENAPRSDQQITLEILEAIKAGDEPTSTGINRLDDVMEGGMYPGKAYGFCARKKIGKTMLAGTISSNLAKAGVKHLFICAEMGPHEIHQRILARELDVYPSAFRSKYKHNPDFQERIAQAAKMQTRSLIYQNAPGITLDQLKLYVSRGVNNYNIKGFILDYWQLVLGKGKSQSDASHYDMVAQWIAQVCKEHGIWALVTAQINQEGNTRGGEGIKLAFDQVYVLHAPENDPSRSDRWLEMTDTRYTEWNNLGSETCPAFMLEKKGLYFKELSLESSL